MPSIQTLRLHSLEDPLPQQFHLVHELPAHVFICDLLQILQVFLLLCRSYHCEAISVLEEVADHSSYPILVLDCIRCTLLFFQRIIEILLRINLVAKCQAVEEIGRAHV